MTLKMILIIHLKLTQENDYFEITGSLDGIAKNGKAFNSVTQESDKLLLYYTCNCRKRGISDVELPDFIYNADVSFSRNGIYFLHTEHHGAVNCSTTTLPLRSSIDSAEPSIKLNSNFSTISPTFTW